MQFSVAHYFNELSLQYGKAVPLCLFFGPDTSGLFLLYVIDDLFGINANKRAPGRLAVSLSEFSCCQINIMTESEKIKIAVERTTKALSLKPSLGQATGISKASIKNGLTCEITEGNWKLIADMPASVGGNNTGPTPGVYGRAALGSCLAIAYIMQAAKKEIPITSLDVEVHADYDDGALLGTTKAAPGYSAVRYTVTIESPAPEEDVMKMIDDADLHSPYLDVFNRGQNCKRDVHLVVPKLQS